MIRTAKQQEIEEIARYAFRLNSIKEHKCKAFPTDYEGILAQFEKMDKHPNDKVLVCTDGTNIQGILALLVEPENMFMEAIGGVFAEKNYAAVAMEFYEYMEENYPGYHFDAAYPEENQQAIDFIESIGAMIIDYDYELRVNKKKYIPIDEIHHIIHLNEKYYKDFVDIHDKYNPNVYWTGDRLLMALDKFDIFIALDSKRVVGSIVTSKFNKNVREIYLMAVEEGKRHLDYEIALINRTVGHAFDNEAEEIMVMAEKNNLKLIKDYESLGFEKTDTCITYSMNI